jgi:hypothetical protein
LFVTAFVATMHINCAEHYVVPAAPLLYLLVVQCFRRVSLWRWWWLDGRRLAITWVAVCMLLHLPSLWPHAGRMLQDPEDLPDGPVAANKRPWLADRVHSWLTHPPRPRWSDDRTQLERRLKRQGGRHLVLVEYSADHSCLEEWVYNEADIDRAQVVWARPMNADGIRRLAEYYPDRSIWALLVAPREGSLKLLRGPQGGTLRRPGSAG